MRAVNIQWHARTYSGAHRRHEHLQGALIYCIRKAGGLARRATVKELRAPGDTSQKKADVVADNFANASRTTLFDVVVVHPSISSFKLFYDRAGAAAADRSQSKNNKYKDLAEALDYLFTDFAVETYGRMSDAARKVIKQLGDMYEQLHGGDDSDGYVPRSVFVDHCRQVIGIALKLPGHAGTQLPLVEIVTVQASTTMGESHGQLTDQVIVVQCAPSHKAGKKYYICAGSRQEQRQ